MATDRPSRDEICMGWARLAALRSTCSRAQVGVVFALEGRPLVSGYNGAPAGMAHCDHECNCMAPQVPRATKKTLSHIDWCQSLPAACVAVHAEANAVAWAARCGIKLEGSTLYTTYTPCIACAQLLVNVGIGRVWAQSAYRLPHGRELLQKAGISVLDWPRSK